METMSFRSNTSTDIIRTNTNYKNQQNNNTNNNNENSFENIIRKSNIDIVKNKIGSSKINNIFSLLHKRQSIQTTKPLLDIENITNSDDFNNNACYIINSTKEFETQNNNDVSLSIINEIGELLTKEFPNENDIIEKSISDILEETNKKVKDNKSLINLVGQLKYLKLDIIDTKTKCLAFWLNCFNYLILFAIFYKKWNINGEKKWKKFFKNVKFNIGGKYFCFNDMQYILFKKPSFISCTYKTPDEIKKLNIEKISGDKKYDEYMNLIPFILYLPIKKFLYPSLYNYDNIEKQINLRINNYINKYIYIDGKNHLCCNELLLKYESNIFGKGLKKYETNFKPEIYNNIKEKKYKKIDTQKIAWKLNFDNLIENCNKNDEKNNETNE